MLEVVKAPDTRLRTKTKPIKKITPSLHQTLKEMVKLTKTFVDPEGVGLASTQIGKDEQYFVAKNQDNSFTAVLNPEIIKYGPRKKLFFEGCLSIPDYYGEIERPTTVQVRYMTPDGKKVEKNLVGLEAWIFQHEYDHLHGRLFMDLVLEQKAKLYKVVGKDRTGADIFEEVKI